MYIQWFAKGISGDAGALDWATAKNLITDARGIQSNWWRNIPGGKITPTQVDAVLTDGNLDRHVHDYANFGPHTPFISVAAGCVERDTLLSQNHIYSALTTALDFATDAGRHPGAIFYGWVLVALNPAVPLSAVAEEIRDLNVYHRWSPFQLEGEITAKIHIPSNQIEHVEWWDGHSGQTTLIDSFPNPGFVKPTPITNIRELF
ncbi:hypothetical protein C1D09_000780 [Mesorhizobium intechi]|uniref:hypothetical protein n=1 Tax=Mesorhizobium intechi TaxID=537601 RepID=UPI000CAE4DE2|nr:hypothetical protein [Mesorhizobium intechi]TSE14056.1 hypothetical protein C1D09_000780 [Mesorhizobium intechi]